MPPPPLQPRSSAVVAKLSVFQQSPPYLEGHIIHRLTPHTHIHNERFGLELSARHSRSALRHSSQVIVQNVKEFLHVRRECTAVPPMRRILCFPVACAVSNCYRKYPLLTSLMSLMLCRRGPPARWANLAHFLTVSADLCASVRICRVGVTVGVLGPNTPRGNHTDGTCDFCTRPRHYPSAG